MSTYYETRKGVFSLPNKPRILGESKGGCVKAVKLSFARPELVGH